MAGSVAELVSLLELEALGDDTFLGPERWFDGSALQRVFGGQVLAQALLAAYRTAPAGRVAHSLGAYFLREGRLGTPITYRVERSRDGGSFSSRSVSATQGDRLIFSMVCSFHAHEPGLPTTARRWRRFWVHAPSERWTRGDASGEPSTSASPATRPRSVRRDARTHA